MGQSINQLISQALFKHVDTDGPVMEPDLELRMGEGSMRVGLFCFACPADFSPYVISSFLTQDKRGGCLDPPLRPVFIRKKIQKRPPM